MAKESNGQIVRDVGKWEWAEMWKKEDWFALIIHLRMFVC